MSGLIVTVDNRLRLDTDGVDPNFLKQLREATTHLNPEYSKKRALGLWVGALPNKIRTWSEENGFSLPRGVTRGLRDAAKQHGIGVKFVDKRVSVPAQWPPFLGEPRWYQETGIERCMAVEQGIIKAPTGSGKTLMALALLPRLGQRALVIVRDRQLLEQWLDVAEKFLGLSRKQIGVVASGKRKVGECLTLSLQQTLYSKSFPMKDFAKMFGAVIVDEVHDAAARTVNETVNAFHARVRLGFSADHTRKDRKEFLVEDLFGDVIYRVNKAELEASGSVVPVVVRLVPTDFQADWYANAPSEERDFTRLIKEMVDDEPRCRLIRRVVTELVEANSVPALVFTHRREHAMRLAESELPADGVPTGLLLGSEANAAQFEESKALLLSGVLKVAVGTFKAVGQGIDIPNVLSGVCATPIGANKQFFGQVRGRICRPVPGKTVGHLYYLWDRLVFPDAARNLYVWNEGLVEIFDRKKKGWVAFR